MAQKLMVRDLTLRDGQQALFSTRMTQEQIDRILPLYRETGFYAMEVWGGDIPDLIMRYLNENPWDRLEKIKEVIGNQCRIAALSRGRNLFGHNPYPEKLIEGFCRNAIRSGVDIMRIFDALNDVDNLKTSIKYVKKYGGTADCAVCYATDPSHSPAERIVAALHGKPLHKPVFTDSYFLDKATQMVALGADMLTIKDMSGLILPSRVARLVTLFKKHFKVPVNFHTHSTPGYGLAATLSAIVNGVDGIDTNIWYFAGGPGAPAIELIYILCKKMGIELELNMGAIQAINEHLFAIRKELSGYDVTGQLPQPFNPLEDRLPAEIDRFFNDAITAARKDKEDDLVLYCRAIESFFDFPEPDELLNKAEIPGVLYAELHKQLKQAGKEDLLEEAMKLVPRVRMDAGLPPLITPVSQIIAGQAVACAQDEAAGRPLYSKTTPPFVSLVKGEYGKTPVPVDPEFRLQITGSREEQGYDASEYIFQDNPELEGTTDKLADNEKEILLLELFPTNARRYLMQQKSAEACVNKI
ncbi:MAG: carboxylase [Tannerellaceae bacterium]|nr:carboxylase [Tannerellaceae bacterium]